VAVESEEAIGPGAPRDPGRAQQESGWGSWALKWGVLLNKGLNIRANLRVSVMRKQPDRGGVVSNIFLGDRVGVVGRWEEGGVAT
jgi:hypothetical protein